jgi:hypothetical protein
VPIALAPGQYQFYKIAPEGTHQEQLAFRSPVDRDATEWWALSPKAGVIYLLTYPDDTPNWGNLSTLVSISPPCGNWNSRLYESDYVLRSQTWGILAAIMAEREKVASILAACAKTDEMNSGITATIQGEPELPVSIYAAIQGEAERYPRIRAAIRAEPELEPAIIAACAKTDELDCGVLAAIRGNPEVHSHLKAAIKGETETSSGIVAFVVKTRVNSILLEMENLFPQELDLRSTPNWASRVKDYRKSGLGARDS